MSLLPLLLLLPLSTAVLASDDSQCLMETQVSGLSSDIGKVTGKMYLSICSDLVPLTYSETQYLPVEDQFKEYEKQGHKKTKSFAVQSEQEYCSSDSRSLLRRLCVDKGKLGHDNEGGIFGIPTGVCWWNSQFHRKMNYLTYFDPKTPSEYSDDEVKDIIHSIHRYEVTQIKGYESFGDFINDKKYPNRKKILQKFLQQQMGKTAVTFEWVNGLKGKANKGKPSQKLINKQLAEIEKFKAALYPEKGENAHPPFAVVQYPGPIAHAYLVNDLIELSDGQGNKAFQIRVQDSAYQEGVVFEEPETYVFDVLEGKWFKPSQYAKLIKLRGEGKKARVVDIPAGWMKSEDHAVMNAPDGVGAMDWTLTVRHEDQMDKIDRAFKKKCGRSFFSP